MGILQSFYIFLFQGMADDESGCEHISTSIAERFCGDIHCFTGIILVSVTLVHIWQFTTSKGKALNLMVYEL